MCVGVAEACAAVEPGVGFGLRGEMRRGVCSCSICDMRNMTSTYISYHAHRVRIPRHAAHTHAPPSLTRLYCSMHSLISTHHGDDTCDGSMHLYEEACVAETFDEETDGEVAEEESSVRMRCDTCQHDAVSAMRMMQCRP